MADTTKRLLDANVFITAKNSYYQMDIFPAFWSWLDDQAELGALGSTDLVFDELKDGDDNLATWVKKRRQSLFYLDSSSESVASHVDLLWAWAEREGYRTHVIEEFMSGADPFLAGVAVEGGLRVVTLETPARGRKRKVKLPDACDHLGVEWEDTFGMLRNLGARFV